MKELILNFNDIGMGESIIAFCGYLIYGIIILLVAIAAIMTAYSTHQKGKLIKTIAKGIGIFVAASLFASSLLSIVGDNYVRENRLKEIIETANKEGLSSNLVINDTSIIYDDIACKHNIRDIDKLIYKTDNGQYIFVED